MNYVIRVSEKSALFFYVSKNGVFHKGEHKKVVAYSANVAFDKNKFGLEFVINSVNKHDSTEFLKLYEKLKRNYKHIKNIVVDAGYKTPTIAKQVLNYDKILVTAYQCTRLHERAVKRSFTTSQ